MRCSIILSTLCLAATAVAQAVSEGIAPSAAAPSGCKPNFSGNFTLNTASIANTQGKEVSEVVDSAVTVTLKNGILHDSFGRTGDIVANHQFQFDGPPQAGSIYTGGWSICANDSLALGGSAIFYKCASGNFYNLYDISIGDQCIPCYIVIAPVAQASPTTTSIAASGSANSNSHQKLTMGSTASSASGTISVTSSISASALASANSAITTGVLSSGFATAAITISSSRVSGAATAASGTAQSFSAAAALAAIALGRTVFGAVAGMLGDAFVLY